MCIIGWIRGRKRAAKRSDRRPNKPDFEGSMTQKEKTISVEQAIEAVKAGRLIIKGDLKTPELDELS